MKTFEELTPKEKNLYKWCLHIAGYDEKKAIKYYNSGVVPLKDAIEMVDGKTKAWFKAMDKEHKIWREKNEMEWKAVILKNIKKDNLKKANNAEANRKEKEKKHFLKNYKYDKHGHELKCSNAKKIEAYIKRYKTTRSKTLYRYGFYKSVLAKNK